MIKRKLSHLITILFYILTPMHLYAANWDYRDIKQFPLQPIVLEHVTQTWIKPVEMTSWGFGKSYVRYHRNVASIFSANGPALSMWSRHVYEAKRDLPFGKSHSSLGMDITLFGDFMDPSLSSFKSYFSNFVGADILGSYKFKKNISTFVGDIIGTVAPKIGIIAVVRGLDETDLKARNHICYPVGFGMVGGIGVGIDYYPSQWFGFFIEYTLKFNAVLKWLSPPLADSMNAYGVNYYKGSYAFPSDAITFGFKTTF